MILRSKVSGNRDVVNVIVDFRRALREVSSGDYPDVAAEYLLQLFEGSAAALNLMDYGHLRYQTLSNVGQLSPGESPTTKSEFYPFSDFPFTTQHLARDDGRSFDEGDEDLAVACGATLARFFRPSWAAAGWRPLGPDRVPP